MFFPFLSTLFVLMAQIHLQDAKEAMNDGQRLHFVLVHGAGHGAWCWFKVTDMLLQQGHQVDTIDLISAGKDSADPTAVGTLENYSLPLIQLLESLNDHKKVILVGHSMAGISLAYATEKFPSKISRAIYVASLMFSNNATRTREIFSQVVAGSSLEFITPTGSMSPTAARFDLNLAPQILYQKSPTQDVVLAKSLLKPFPSLDPVVSITSENYGRIPRYYIKTKQDQSIPVAFQEKMIQENPPVKVAELNTDHSPFFSMPKALVDLLLEDHINK